MSSNNELCYITDTDIDIVTDEDEDEVEEYRKAKLKTTSPRLNNYKSAENIQ